MFPALRNPEYTAKPPRIDKVQEGFVPKLENSVRVFFTGNHRSLQGDTSAHTQMQEQSPIRDFQEQIFADALDLGNNLVFHLFAQSGSGNGKPDVFSVEFETRAGFVDDQGKKSPPQGFDFR